ncbi:MAG: 5'/3'-nucleotidase SurE [Anaerolineae bacterium]|nr:5'/3'-nucleotidase SurE [Anaerolineae bacterium]
MARPLILLTNDDGVNSPGLLAVAKAFDSLGDLLIVAPQEQQSGMGRSVPSYSDGRLFPTTIGNGEQSWEAYGVNASPAQAVLHGLLELADRRPSLVVSGVNYGENITTSVTSSGTVGAAFEAAARGFPALAVSLQVDPTLFLSHDNSVDFSAAGHFARLFAEHWLTAGLPDDVDVLKIDVPTKATRESEWRITRLERQTYFLPLPPERESPDAVGPLGYTIDIPQNVDPDTDLGALLDVIVSVTPLSLDMTSRIDLSELGDLLQEQLRI